MSRPVTIAAVGDIMLGDSPQVFGSGVGSMIARHGPLHPFLGVAEELRGADIRLGNLEVVVSGFDPRVTPFDQQVYRGQPNALDGLVHVGFEVVSLCTNHMMQHGRCALEECLCLLEARGIRVIGVEMPEREVHNRCVLEHHGLRLAFLGYNFRPQQYFVDPPQWRTPTFELIRDEIALVRDRANVVVVTLHWGDEFIECPAPDQVALARRLVDHGADAIIGHHTHIVQGVERYRGAVIAYSLGNFVYDQWQPRLRRSMILRLIIGGRGDLDYEIVPVMINSEHQPQLLDGPAAADAVRTLRALGQRIGTVSTEAYRAELTRNYRRFRREVYGHYLRQVFRTHPKHTLANVAGAIQRRL